MYKYIQTFQLMCEERKGRIVSLGVANSTAARLEICSFLRVVVNFRGITCPGEHHSSPLEARVSYPLQAIVRIANPFVMRVLFPLWFLVHTAVGHPHIESAPWHFDALIIPEPYRSLRRVGLEVAGEQQAKVRPVVRSKLP